MAACDEEGASYMASEAASPLEACDSPLFSRPEGDPGSDHTVAMACALVAAFLLEVAWEMALVS